jgi:hypothetical protein
MLLLLVFAGPLGAWQPSWPVVYLTWEGTPTHSMTIHWITDNWDEEESVVHVRAIGSAEAWPVEAEHRCLPNSSYHNFHAQVADIEPDTIYAFWVDDLDKEWRFSTLPTSLTRPVTFVEGGDFYQSRIARCLDTTRQAALCNPDFMVVGGDLVYSCDRYGIFAEGPRRWLRWLDMLAHTLLTEDGRLVPIVAAIGNHDVSGRYHRQPSDAVQFFALFRSYSQCSYQRFDCGDYLSLFLLDSGHCAEIDGPQRDWLEEELKADSPSHYRFAVYHVPAWPAVRSMTSNTSPQVRAHWVPLFEEYGVQLAFEHHDHSYKRTHPILGESEHPEGVIYLGDGAWGCKVRKCPASDERWYLKTRQHCQHFICAELSSNRALFRAINKEGAEIDRVELRGPAE